MTTPVRPSLAARVASPFAGATPPRRRSLIDRLAKRARPDLAAEALTHVLGQRAPKDLTENELTEMLAEYGVAGDAAREVLRQVWQRALAAFLADDMLTNEEIAYLEVLRHALTLDEGDVARARAELIHPRFRRVIDEVVADHRIEPAERERLSQLSAALRLSPEVERELFRGAVVPVLQRFVDGTVADRQLTDEEREHFRELMRHLDIELPPERVTLHALSYYALLWRLENRTLPVVGSPLRLRQGEACHLYLRARWHEAAPESNMSGVWPRANFGSPSGRASGGTAGRASGGTPGVAAGPADDGVVRIARGLLYRVSGPPHRRLDPKALPAGDSGTLYLTTQRMVFEGVQGTHELLLSDIIELHLFTNAIRPVTRSGRAPVAEMDEGVELAAMVLTRVMARA